MGFLVTGLSRPDTLSMIWVIRAFGPEGRKFFLRASGVYWRFCNLFIFFPFKVAKSSGSRKATAEKMPSPTPLQRGLSAAGRMHYYPPIKENSVVWAVAKGPERDSGQFKLRGMEKAAILFHCK